MLIVQLLIWIKIVLIVVTIPWIVFALSSVWVKKKWIVVPAAVLSQVLFWGVLLFLGVLTVLLLVWYHRETWVAFVGMFSSEAAEEEILFPRYLVSLFLWLLIYFMVIIAVLLISLYTERPRLVLKVL